ncbi:endonuclease domain-containing protein [Methylobacter sp.]|uniref:endonuclease domain-containing protein n=1 Tax=Methylobacter sp. TaxID=2051955 RepID=UPI002FDE5B47
MGIPQKSLARALRINQTDAERLIWNQLRNRRMVGCKFRRQQIIGPYIADFLCMEPKLVIELDGGQHLQQQASDEQRTQYLQKLGYKVLRFWNHEVLRETQAVLDAIRLEIINLIPSPRPSPGGRGG